MMIIKKYSEINDDELKVIYDDIVESKKTGKRVESLVPFAQLIKENIGGDFTLREALEWMKQDFFNEVASRYFK